MSHAEDNKKTQSASPGAADRSSVKRDTGPRVLAKEFTVPPGWTLGAAPEWAEKGRPPGAGDPEDPADLGHPAEPGYESRAEMLSSETSGALPRDTLRDTVDHTLRGLQPGPSEVPPDLRPGPVVVPSLRDPEPLVAGPVDAAAASDDEGAASGEHGAEDTEYEESAAKAHWAELQREEVPAAPRPSNETVIVPRVRAKRERESEHERATRRVRVAIAAVGLLLIGVIVFLVRRAEREYGGSARKSASQASATAAAPATAATPAPVAASSPPAPLAPVHSAPPAPPETAVAPHAKAQPRARVRIRKQAPAGGTTATAAASAGPKATANDTGFPY
jgi:hypothetical protein